MTVSGVEVPDCSTSLAQEGILGCSDGCCSVEIAVCEIEKSGGGCDTWLVPRRSGSCDELCGPTGTDGELVSLSEYRWSSPELEEEVAGEGSGFTRA